jgi:hypothetical protein
MMPNGKASAVAPKLSDGDHVELSDMLPGGPETNAEEDIMQLARLGDIQGIEKLYESGKFDASYCDAEGITPLHVFSTAVLFVADLLTSFSSGPQSTINMQCANFSLRLVRM